MYIKTDVIAAITFNNMQTVINKKCNHSAISGMAIQKTPG